MTNKESLLRKLIRKAIQESGVFKQKAKDWPHGEKDPRYKEPPSSALAQYKKWMDEPDDVAHPVPPKNEAVTRYAVGDKVVITPACIQRMKDSNRSAVHPNYPSDSFIAKATKLVGTVGEVTHVFPPGYEVSARFGTQAFHMKDNWIEQASSQNEIGRIVVRHNAGVDADIAKAKQTLVQRWKSKGAHENFGQDVVRKLYDKYGSYSPESKAIRAFSDWCSSYTGKSEGNLTEQNAKCEGCGLPMTPGSSCKIVAMKGKDGKWYNRVPNSGGTCHDCNAGKIHHWGCDSEKCPVCHSQIMGGSCGAGCFYDPKGTQVKKMAEGASRRPIHGSDAEEWMESQWNSLDDRSYLITGAMRKFGIKQDEAEEIYNKIRHERGDLGEARRFIRKRIKELMNLGVPNFNAMDDDDMPANSKDDFRKENEKNAPKKSPTANPKELKESPMLEGSVWKLRITKDRPTRWSYFLTNPQGGGFGSGSYTSQKQALRAATHKTKMADSDQVFLTISIIEGGKERIVRQRQTTFGELRYFENLLSGAGVSESIELDVPDLPKGITTYKMPQGVSVLAKGKNPMSFANKAQAQKWIDLLKAKGVEAYVPAMYNRPFYVVIREPEKLQEGSIGKLDGDASDVLDAMVIKNKGKSDAEILKLAKQDNLISQQGVSDQELLGYIRDIRRIYEGRKSNFQKAVGFKKKEMCEKCEMPLETCLCAERKRKKEAKKTALKEISVPEKHQLNLALKTLKLNVIGANMIGIGYKNAVDVLRKNGYSDGKIMGLLKQAGHSADEINGIMGSGPNIKHDPKWDKATSQSPPWAKEGKEYKTQYTVKCRNCDNEYKTGSPHNVGASCPKCGTHNSHNDYKGTAFVKEGAMKNSRQSAEAFVASEMHKPLSKRTMSEEELIVALQDQFGMSKYAAESLVDQYASPYTGARYAHKNEVVTAPLRPFAGNLTKEAKEWLRQKQALKEQWHGWNEKMPVQVVGVANGKITPDGRGVQVFPDLQSAKAVFPNLNPDRQSKDFTWAMRGKVSGEDAIRFETWKANDIYST